MIYEMAENPTREQLAQLRALKLDRALWMISLLKFRTFAQYEDGSDKEMSGRDAYARYGDALEPFVNAAGGRLVAMGDYKGLFIGSGAFDFDVATIVEFPSVARWFDLLNSKDVLAISVHRKAGLEKQLLFLAEPRTAI
jgi:uncharacterized protein (DUF1330 family)